jgi:GntR family transcriptional regulator, transcriptional repressor for pyruvate dehydrogenase complex
MTFEAGARKETLYARTARHVRELIADKDLAPGDRLPTERELAQTLGVSRVPIREAIRTLAAQGIVEVRRGQGMFVGARGGVEATVEELTATLLRQRDAFRDLFAVRRLLEPASAQWAATRIDDEGVAALTRIVQRMEVAAAPEPPDLEAMEELDAQLHVELAVASENRVLLRIMQAIQDLHREQIETSIRYRGRVHQTLRDHRRIVAAIAAHDPVEARAAMVDHLANSEAAALGRLDAAGSEA